MNNMEFQPGDRVYHTSKQGYATVVMCLDEDTTLIEFDEPVGTTHRGCKPRHGWRADNGFLNLVSEAPDDTPIDISNLI